MARYNDEDDDIDPPHFHEMPSLLSGSSEEPRRGSHSDVNPVQGPPPHAYDFDEDLAECIAAWQASQGEGGLRTSFDFPLSRQGPSPLRCPSAHRPATSIEEDNFTTNAGPELFGPALTLNVGGVLFRTTPSTLRKAPFFESLLRHSGSGGEGGLGATTDAEGHFFVDRSGFLFTHILEYLRTGHWLLGDKACDLEFIEAIREEASFYGLEAHRHRLPVPRISEYVAIWQFRDDHSLYVDCLEQTIREDPDHQGLFRLCKYSGGLPLDQSTFTKRFKATSHCVQSVIAYFGMRGFSLCHVVQASMITHTTSAD
ncbi:unnamed protein product, partial [Polarella glacialis]